MSYKQTESKSQCPRCAENGRDSNGDNLHNYGEGKGSFCFSCNYTILSDDEKERRGIGKFEWDDEMEAEVATKEPLTKEELERIKGYTGTKGKMSRGISDETYKAYGCRFEYEEESGNVAAHYYGVTKDYEPVGFKIRRLPKDFVSVGKIGKDSDLFGQWKFKKSNSRTVLVTAGECFAGDTEVLTENGFIRFDCLPKNLKVLQVHENGSGEYVEPLAYVEKDYSGDFINYDGPKFSIHSTPDHNLVYWNTKGKPLKKKAKEPISARHHIKLATKVSGEGTGLTQDQIALTLAICADSKYDVRVDGRKYVHFGFLKERKIARLKGILERLDIKYTSYVSTHKNWKTYTTFNFNMPSYIKDKKIPAEWVGSATLEEKDFILEELRWWDGNVCKDYVEFNSKHYDECSTVQALCVTSGRYSRIRKRTNSIGTWYVCSIHSKELTGNTQNSKRLTTTFSGKVYCVTVPSGMIQIRREGKTAIVGNCDCLSAYQMLENYRKSKNNDYDPTPVVSSVIGESGSAKQLQKQYEFLNRFDKIVVCYDSDQAGKDAVGEVAKVLPKGKMYVMELPLKDTNAMLEAGREKEWINCFFKAKAYTPNGIVASSDLMDKIIQEATTPKIPLPPFMHKVQDMMAGGIPLGVVVNLASASGTGKSTIVDELTYFWVFNSPHKIGVVTLESDCGQYGTKILSRHISQKIDLISDVDTKLDFLAKPEIIEQANILWNNPDGSPRWYLVDERDGGLEDLKEQIMKLIIACDCKVIILDPIQDILDGLGNDEQAVFLRWMKGTIKSHKVTFINVNHVRKNGTGQKANSAGADLHEEDMMGSSTLFKSSACNLLFTRNKEAEDEIERNTTKMKASKIRWTGKTGCAGEYYYDNETHTVHDKEDYFSSRGGEFYAN